MRWFKNKKSYLPIGTLILVNLVKWCENDKVHKKKDYFLIVEQEDVTMKDLFKEITSHRHKKRGVIEDIKIIYPK